MADNDHVQAEGKAARIGKQPMAVVCAREGKKGKVYLAVDELSDEDAICRRIDGLCRRAGLTVPDELINPLRPSPNARGLSAVTRHGFRTFGHLFTPRQMLCLLTFAATVRETYRVMTAANYNPEHAKAVGTMLACNVDKLADRNSQFCNLLADGGRGIKNTFARQALAMTWDFAEANPFNADIASWQSCFKEIVWNIQDLSNKEPVQNNFSNWPLRFRGEG